MFQTEYKLNDVIPYAIIDFSHLSCLYYVDLLDIFSYGC